MREVWKLVGYDAFDEEHYPLQGEYPDEEAVQQAGAARFRSLEETQPTKSSGGQGEFGIQDRVFIQRPDGTLYRFIPLPPEPPIEQNKV